MTPARREAVQKYNHSDKRRAAQRRYERTPKGRATLRRYALRRQRVSVLGRLSELQAEKEALLGRT